MHKRASLNLQRVFTALVILPVLAVMLGGWGFFSNEKRPVKEPDVIKPVTLRDIPLGLYDHELRFRKGEPNWQTVEGDLIYEEPTASYAVTLDPQNKRVIRVCEVGDQFEVLGVRAGDSLSHVIETVGVPSAELLNRETTDGQIIYARQKVAFSFRNRRVHEVCVMTAQEQKRLLAER